MKTIKEYAEENNISKWDVYRMVRDGELEVDYEIRETKRKVKVVKSK